jgi:hypothetical protein
MHHEGDCPTRPHAAALRLRSTLERLAGALTAVNLEAMLACESDLASTLAELGDRGVLEPASRAATARELQAAGSALTRCRRLGATLGDLTRLSLAARGADPAYNRTGETRSHLGVHALEAKV